MGAVKTEAKKMVERMTSQSTWEDLMREIYVRQSVETGLEDARRGRVVSVEKVRARFGLPR